MVENREVLRVRDVKKLMGTDMYLAYLRDPSGNKICALKEWLGC